MRKTSQAVASLQEGSQCIHDFEEFCVSVNLEFTVCAGGYQKSVQSLLTFGFHTAVFWRGRPNSPQQFQTSLDTQALFLERQFLGGFLAKR